MHRPFYASGFLYHSSTQQILLQQPSLDASPVLFGGKGHKAKDPQAVFQRCVEQALGIAIPASSIHPVYDYRHNKLGECFIFYVEIADPEIYASKNKAKWFLLSKLSKFTMSEQTRHDIIVGERVIRSALESPQAHQSPKHH